jgi:hypothetical protein
MDQQFQDLQKKYIENFEKNPIYSSLKDLQVQTSNNIKDQQSLGVFAKRNFSKNELIECSPVFQLAWRSNYHHDPRIRQYAFTHNMNCKCNDCQTHGYSFYIALGYASIYNSQKDCHGTWFVSPKHRAWFLVAIKDIKRGEEIFTYYGDGYNMNAFKQKTNQNISLENVDWSKIPLTPTE